MDSFGRVTAASNGSVGGGGRSGSPFIAKYTPDPTNSFIDVSVDALGGPRYKLILEGSAAAGGTIVLRYSSDNGATFASGASDYKSVSVGAASGITISGGAVGSGRDVLSDLLITGLNTGSGRPKVIGIAYSISSGGSPNGITVLGGLNGLAPADFNAVRIQGATGQLAGFTARLYAVD